MITKIKAKIINYIYTNQRKQNKKLIKDLIIVKKNGTIR